MTDEQKAEAAIEKFEEEQRSDAEKKEFNKQYPSVDLIYSIAIASYEAMTKRFDAIDGRIQTMTAFAVTASLALPTLGKTQNISFNSIWFALGIGAILLAIIVSVFARFKGEIWVLDPNILKDKVGTPEHTFKWYRIYLAGEDYEKNKKTLSLKWTLSVISMGLFALAILFLSIWLMLGHQLLSTLPQI